MKEGDTEAASNEAVANESEVQPEIHDNSCFIFALCNPRKPAHRYFVLVFMCLLGFGSYFCYDIPGAIQDQIMNDMSVSTLQFANLYAWYSWPNVILCFCGGFLIDKVFGIRLGAIIFSSIILVGQLIFALGATVDMYWVMELGRFVFGIGGESLAVTQNTYAVSWFKGKELNMVFGMQLSLARVGSAVNFNVTPAIYTAMSKYYTGHETLGATLFIGALTCVLSLVAALITAFFDWRAEKILNKTAGKTGEVIRLKDIKDFPATFWIITLICVAYYSTIFPFIGLGSVFFARKYDYSHETANSLDSIVYLISAVASPFLGLLVDKTGRNLMWVFVAVFVTLICHLSLAFTFINPWIPMVAIGLTYSLLACGLWPMVALEVPEHQLGTAYGIMQSVQNLGLAVVAIAAGAIVDYKGYIFLEIFFAYCLVASVISTVALFVLNTNRGGSLNLSIKERKIREEELRQAQQLENERLLQDGHMTDVTPHDLLQPQSVFHIRNRFLSRLGHKFPANFDVTTCALMHRTGLK